MPRKRVERNISFDSSRKKYYATLYFGFTPDGKPIKKTLSFKTITEARKALREHEYKKDCQSLVAPSKLTVKDWLSYWLDNIIKPNREKTTVYGYENMITNHINPYLGRIPLQKITPQKLQMYYTYLRTEKKLGTNTVRKHHDLLRSAFAVAVRQDVLPNNPADRVEPPKQVIPTRYFYTKEDLNRLLECAKGHKLELAIQLAAFLGLRRGECCGLRWSDIDFDHHILHIHKARTSVGGEVIEKGTKTTSSIRTLHIPAVLEQTLRRELHNQQENRKIFGESYHDSNHVLVWEDGLPYRPNYISEAFKSFLNANDLPFLTFHGLRHTFATLANSAGVPLYDISKTLGHSTVSTTSTIYTHVIDSSHKDTIEQLAAFVYA